MEFKIKNHKVSLYGNFKDGFILRVYDGMGYVHFVIDLLKYRKGSIVWRESRKYFNGDYKPLF